MLKTSGKVRTHISDQHVAAATETGIVRQAGPGGEEEEGDGADRNISTLQVDGRDEDENFADNFIVEEEEEIEDDHLVLGMLNAGTKTRVTKARGFDYTFSEANYPTSQLTEFFSRPIHVGTYNWDVGTDFDLNINPWAIFLTNAQVKKKLDNFQYFRGNLVLQFLINGTPFHYGKLMVSYAPMTRFLFPAGSTRTLMLMRRSQRMHTFIDPSTNGPIEMELPFMSLVNYINLPFNIADERAQLGDININSLNLLRAASATATPNVKLTIFMWATEVALTIPTSVSQAGPPGKKEGKKGKKGARLSRGGSKNGKTNVAKRAPKEATSNTEQKVGPIESTSSAIASAAGHLENVPFIGDFAKAVNFGASNFSKVASIWGWSRPVVLDKHVYAEQRIVGDLASSGINETISRLTFDPKQGVTVDPQVVGIKEESDSMAINSIIQKESFLVSVPWTQEQAPGSEIFWSNVNPTMTRDEVDSNGYTRWQLTSLAFGSLPFRYWSGSIVYRFQFVCSQYHCGRVKVVWEPNGSVTSFSEFNTSYSKVIDLTQTRDVEISIAWGQHLAYKQMQPLSRQYEIPPAGVKNYNPGTCNGFISVYVLNELVAPDTNSDIDVNVFVRAGRDLELMCPWSRNIKFAHPDNSAFAAYEDNVAATRQHSRGVSRSVQQPSSIATIEEEEEPGAVSQAGPSEEIADAEGDARGASQTVALLERPALSMGNLKPLVYSGEKLMTFRNMVKRYSVSTICHHLPAPGPQGLVYTLGALATEPSYYGYNFDGAQSETIGSPASEIHYNIQSTSLLAWLQLAYVGYRGAFRHKVLFAFENQDKLFFSLSRNEGNDGSKGPDPSDTRFSTQAYFLNDATHPVQELTEAAVFGWAGSTLSKAPYNVLETEVPYYSKLRFCPCGKTWGSIYDLTNPLDAALDRIVRQPQIMIQGGRATDDHEGNILGYQAVGDDFTFLWYQGPPPIYFNRMGTAVP